MTIDEINALHEPAFVARFGGLAEHSPWVLAEAAKARPFADEPAMLAAIEAAIASAPPDAKLALLRAHPELAGKAAIDRTLTEASEAEQVSAGLDRLMPEEFAAFHDLNRAYADRFGFPFIICVRLTNKAGILAAMHARLAHDAATERATALAEVNRIIALRLADMVPA